MDQALIKVLQHVLITTLSCLLYVTVTETSYENRSEVQSISGWTESCMQDAYSEHCYQIVDTKITWDSASNFCKRDGGNLVIIESSKEQEFIADLLHKKIFKASGLWIGSRTLHPENQRVWDNGEKFTYVNWAKGEPNYPYTDQDCLEISIAERRWNDDTCTQLNGFICENTREVETYIQDIITRRWYKIVDSRVTWMEAFDICRKDGGMLMVIETAYEQSFIANQIRRTFTKSGELWLGSNKMHPEKERIWINGRKFTYTNWAEGQPNNHKAIENCAEMFTSNSTWNDGYCNSHRGYICEKTKHVNIVVSQPTIIIISVSVVSALVLVGVTILGMFCIIRKRNTCMKKKRDDEYVDIQNVEMNQAEKQYDQRNAPSDIYTTIVD